MSTQTQVVWYRLETAQPLALPPLVIFCFEQSILNAGGSLFLIIIKKKVTLELQKSLRLGVRVYGLDVRFRAHRLGL